MAGFGLGLTCGGFSVGGFCLVADVSWCFNNMVYMLLLWLFLFDMLVLNEGFDLGIYSPMRVVTLECYFGSGYVIGG